MGTNEHKHCEDLKPEYMNCVIESMVHLMTNTLICDEHKIKLLKILSTKFIISIIVLENNCTPESVMAQMKTSTLMLVPDNIVKVVEGISTNKNNDFEAFIDLLNRASEASG